jgi:hypothetical protein
LNEKDAVVAAHDMAQRTGHPTAVWVRIHPGGNEGSCVISDAHAPKPQVTGRHELVMIVSVTGLERRLGRWADREASA